MRLAAEDRVVVEQRRLDLVVAWQCRALGEAKLPGRLALGKRSVADAVLGDQPSRDLGDARPLVAVTDEDVVPLDPAADAARRVFAAIPPRMSAHG
jgi:hypothetical protein